MRAIGAAVVVALGAAGGGCATVLSGTEQRVPVETVPAGAEVMVEGDTRVWSAPTELDLSRKRAHTLILKKAGYHTLRVRLGKSLNGAFLGNAILGGVVGGVADVFSGAAGELVPSRVAVTLEPVGPDGVVRERVWMAPTYSRENGTEETPATSMPAEQVPPERGGTKPATK